MKDDFLYNNRPPVRKEFADRLHRQLSNQYPNKPATRKGTFVVKRQLLWKLAALSALLLTILTFAISEDARAQVVQWFRVVAGFQVSEQSQSPIATLDEGNPAATPTISPTEISTPTLVVIPTSLPQTILANPPFAFGIPQYIPDGFALSDDAAIANSNSWVSLVWASQNAEISMLVEQPYTGYPIPAGIDSTEEIQVNGQPALLIRGWWDANHEWDVRRGLELHWHVGDLHYHLNYSQRSTPAWEIEPIRGDTDQIVQDLVRMAESVP